MEGGWLLFKPMNRQRGLFGCALTPQARALATAAALPLQPCIWAPLYPAGHLPADDPAWLPDENGCGEVWQLMEDVPEVIMHLALLSFAPPTEELIAVSSRRLHGICRPAAAPLPHMPPYCVQTHTQSRLRAHMRNTRLPLLQFFNNSTFNASFDSPNPQVSASCRRGASHVHLHLNPKVP